MFSARVASAAATATSIAIASNIAVFRTSGTNNTYEFAWQVPGDAANAANAVICITETTFTSYSLASPAISVAACMCLCAMH